MVCLDAATAQPATEESILSPEAVAFLGALQRRFALCRQELLTARGHRQRQFDCDHIPGPFPEADYIRKTDWALRPALDFGQVMLAGPPERGFLSFGADSGASVLIADFDDCLSPTWANCLESHASVQEALGRFGGDVVRKYPLVSVRPRNWSVEEKHFLVDGLPMSASLFDFGLSMFHTVRTQAVRPPVALFSLGKLEGHGEAGLWAEIFRFTEKQLDLPQGFIRVIVTIDTISAASAMEEFLFELRDYATALECSPVNYLSSFVRSFRVHGESLLPQRSDITRNQPFLQAYRELMVHTCLKHQVHAIGSCFPHYRVRDDARKSEFETARAALEIRHEIELGFNTICIADADLIPAALSAFKQAARRRSPRGHDVGQCHITFHDLILPCYGKITMTALNENVELALECLEGWLAGRGSVRLPFGTTSMAAAELCRAQLWQWIRHSAPLACGRRVSRYMIENLIRDSLAGIECRIGEAEFKTSKFRMAADLLLGSSTDGFDSPLAMRAYAHLA